MKYKNRALALLLTLLFAVSLAMPAGLASAQPEGQQFASTRALEVTSKAKKKKKTPKPSPKPTYEAIGALADVAEQTRAEAEPEQARAEEPELVTAPPVTEPPVTTQAPAAEPPAPETPDTESNRDSGDAPTEKPATTPESIPQIDPKALPVVVEFYAKVNGIKTTEWVADPLTIKKGSKVDINTINPRPYISYNGMTYYLNPVKWDTASIAGLKKVNKDMKVYALYDTAMMANQSLGYSGSQGEELSINIAAAYLFNGTRFVSNDAEYGGQIDEYVEGILPSTFSQGFVSSTDIRQMSLQVSTQNSPFGVNSISKANGNRYASSIVIDARDIPEEYREGLSGPINKGLASFPLVISNSTKGGTYNVPFILSWTDSANNSFSTEVYVTVKVSKKSNSGGGGGGGGGISTPKTLPQARLYIDSVRTEPEKPKAGDDFELVLSMINTSKQQYLQNLLISWTASDDVLMPAGEKTNQIHIKRLDADSTTELRIPVESLPELPNKLVKVDVNMEFEDSKVASHTESQSLIVTVLPVQRVKVDDPKLPSSVPMAGEEYELQIPITNSGKTPLYNVTARIVSDNDDLIIGSPANIGTIEPGANKTGDLDVTPIEEGNYQAQIEITFENESGDKGDPIYKELNFTATELSDDDYNYFDESQYISETPVPEMPSAQAIMAMLPWQLFAGVGLLLMLLIVSMSVSARRRRRRAMEDDEME